MSFAVRHFTAICWQCKEHLANLIVSAVAREPAQSAEAIGESQSEKSEHTLEASEQSAQGVVMSINSVPWF